MGITNASIIGIAQPRWANSGGFIFSNLNPGAVVNKGMEIALSGKPIVEKRFSSDVIMNSSYNKSRLVAFIRGIASFYPTDAQFGTVKETSIPKGGNFPGMTCSPYLNELDAKAVPVAQAVQVLQVLTI